jgi:hypothetical protein
MMSKFFIEHPVLANVLAIVLVLIGALCLFRLPIAQYPNIVPPTVQVTTRYPGASARTVVDTIALPIELQVNGAPGMLYMQSTSAYDGTYVLTVTFEIGSDPNMDQVLVQNRVQNAMAQLPQAAQAQGVSIRAKSASILEFVTLDSPDGSRDALYMWNYATINLVNVMGSGAYSMRIWMDPQKLYSFGLEPKDVNGCYQRAEPGSSGGADRHAAGAKRPAIPIYRRHSVAVQRSQPIRRDCRQGSDGPRRPPDQGQGCGAHRPRRADLFAGFQARRQAGCRHRHLSNPRCQFPECCRRSRGKDGGVVSPVSAWTAL